mgnify:CR=1 FL=1
MTAIALTIAGSDSGGGAGIQADLKTFSALGVYGASVVTTITAQNTQGVRAVEDVSPAAIAAQIDAVLDDMAVGGVKIGMVSREETIAVIAERLAARGVRRLVSAGGETSGAVVQALGATTVAIGPEIDPGVPWVLTQGPDALCLALKSGNFGSDDFFTKAWGQIR